jgi:bacteriorhodopsin
MSMSPSFRWLWAGTAMAGCAVASMIVSIATAAAHGPSAVALIFLVLVAVFACIAFVIFALASGKVRAENRELAARAAAKSRAANGHARHDVRHDD